MVTKAVLLSLLALGSVMQSVCGVKSGYSNEYGSPHSTSESMDDIFGTHLDQEEGGYEGLDAADRMHIYTELLADVKKMIEMLEEEREPLEPNKDVNPLKSEQGRASTPVYGNEGALKNNNEESGFVGEISPNLDLAKTTEEDETPQPNLTSTIQPKDASQESVTTAIEPSRSKGLPSKKCDTTQEGTLPAENRMYIYYELLADLKKLMGMLEEEQELVEDQQGYGSSAKWKSNGDATKSEQGLDAADRMYIYSEVLADVKKMMERVEEKRKLAENQQQDGLYRPGSNPTVDAPVSEQGPVISSVGSNEGALNKNSNGSDSTRKINPKFGFPKRKQGNGTPQPSITSTIQPEDDSQGSVTTPTEVSGPKDLPREKCDSQENTQLSKLVNVWTEILKSNRCPTVQNCIVINPEQRR